MKGIITKSLFGITILSAAAAQAQTDKAGDRMMYGKPGSELMTVAALSTAKTTGMAQRVIGTAEYRYRTGSYMLLDSLAYSWSGTRSSVVTAEFTSPVKNIFIGDYDLVTNWNGLSGHPLNKTMKVYDIDGNNTVQCDLNWNPIKAGFDSMTLITTVYTGAKIREQIVKEKGLTGKLENARKETYVYSGADVETLTEIWNQSTGSWDKDQLTVGTYSGTKLMMLLNKRWIGSDWDTVSRQIMTYTGTMVSKTITEYLESGSWSNGYKDEIFFVAGKVVADSQINWNRITAKWELYSYTSYSYSGTEMTEKIAAGWLPSVGSWEFQKDIYVYSGADVVEDIIQYQVSGPGVWSNAFHERYDYDGNNNLITNTREEWDGSTWIPTTSGLRKHYYYEDYSTTGLPGITSKVGKVSVYPNPATTAQVYVDYFTETAGATEVVLTDMLGQQVHRSTEAGSIGDHSVMVPVSALAQGVYFVSIYSGNRLCQTLKLLR